MNALDKLREMLNEAKIPYESYQEKWSDEIRNYIRDKGEDAQWMRNQIIYGRYDQHGYKFDAIFQYGSWGREENLVETYGELGIDEDGNPRIMSAKKAFSIIKKDWDKTKEANDGVNR